MPMILNAWMPPMMKQLMDGHRVMVSVIGCVSEHGPGLMSSSGINLGI